MGWVHLFIYLGSFISVPTAIKSKIAILDVDKDLGPGPSAES